MRGVELNVSTLVVFAFPTGNGAQDVLTVIKDLQRRKLIILEDAATVVRGQDGKPTVNQATSLVGEGAWGGAFWGLLLGLLFFAPFLGMAIGAGAGALMGKFTDVGIDDPFIRDVQRKIKPGQSALFLLVREVTLDRVLPALAPYQPEVLQTSLSKEQEARLRAALGAAPAEAVVAASAVVESEPALPEATAGIVAAEALAPAEPVFKYLFDPSAESLEEWRFVGGGSFALVDDTLEAQPGEDFGVLYYAAETFADFDLRLDFRLDQIDSDSGVFVRFRDPLQPVPDREDPAITYPYDRQQWVAVTTGFEVQLDELGRGGGEERDEHRTGAIYDIPVGPELGQQEYARESSLATGTWHQLEIVVRDNTYQVTLDGMLTTTFTNTDPFRGQPPGRDVSSGYIGLQAFLGRVAFRSVRIRTL
jgi:uncharacterized membrane protein